MLAGGVPAPVAAHLLRAYGRLDGLLAAQRYVAVGPQTTKMERFITKQSGRGIPASAAPYFLEQLQLVEPLLIPAHSSAKNTPAKVSVGRAARHSYAT